VVLAEDVILPAPRYKPEDHADLISVDSLDIGLPAVDLCKADDLERLCRSISAPLLEGPDGDLGVVAAGVLYRHRSTHDEAQRRGITAVGFPEGS
jgi:hypothetical protein